jgi:hypothetical protein
MKRLLKKCRSLWTFPLAMKRFFGKYLNRWTLLMVVAMKKLLGKYHNLWTIPLAFLVAGLQDYIAMVLGWATFTPEKISKIVPALVVFLLAESWIRIYYMLQYPETYHYASIGENKGWESCSEKEKFHYSFQQRLAYLVVFALILYPM